MGNIRSVVDKLTTELAKVTQLPGLVHTPYIEDELQTFGLFVTNIDGVDEHAVLNYAEISDVEMEVFIRANFARGDLGDPKGDMLLELADIADLVRTQMLTAAQAGTFNSPAPSMSARLREWSIGAVPEHNLGTILFHFTLSDFQ